MHLLNSHRFTKPPILKVADRGSANNPTGGASLDMPNAGSILVGNYLIARIGGNNNGTAGAATFTGVTDPRGNTWTVHPVVNQGHGSINDGIQASLAYCKVVNPYTNGDNINFTYSPGAPSRLNQYVEEWSGINPTTPLAVGITSAQGLSNAPSISKTPTAPGQVVYCHVAWEDTTTIGSDSDTTEGSWVNLSLSSDGGGSTGNRIAGAYKSVSGTSAQTYNPIIGASADWVALAMVLQQ